MGTINKEISRFDVTAVYTHPEAHVDIILVHGLNGNPQKTWTSKKTGVYWPTDLLPKTLEDEGVRANVLVYGYNADVAGNKDKNPSTNFIHEHAQTLVNYLTTFRKTKKRLRNPIIWVAHSLGGILLKKALEYSDSVRVAVHEEYRSVYVSTYAIVFLGTPHEGSDLARWGEMLQGMVGHVPRKLFDSEPILIKTLRKDSETLDSINESFLHIQQRFKIHLVHENQKTDLKGTRSLIVDSKSAAPRWYGVSSYGIEADHSGMCKFDGLNAPGYRQITSVITEWVRESPDLIRVRWNVEDQDRRNRAQLDNLERAQPFLNAAAQGGFNQMSVELNETIHPLEISDAPPSPLPMLPITQSSGINTQIDDSHTPRDPLFIHPEAFRPNSYFVGRVEELKDLHHILYDKKRRSEGTSTALIRCQTGGGKTHMARQYVFEHRYDYPGGIFWLRASTIQELEDEFWRIARTVALRDLKDAGTDIKDLQDHTKVVDHVRRWFNGFENWLLVLDGIMFDPGIERFVPDAANTSMILTSTSPAGSGDHHFNNAKLLELPLLSTQEAQELLLLEMEKRKPWTRDDLKQAADLVHLLERLPLMIHVTAQHLKTTYEPLATFLRRYKNKPHVGKIPAYEFVLEQLRARGAMAALNVLSVLAFFEQHTPVEMMALGLRALDKSTPYKTRDAVTHLKPSLNNTLRVLIAFALVERTDSYDLSPTSSRTSKKSLDLPSESMDTLRMHSVIQRYFIESLAEKREHVFWLGRSVGVFCKAFEEADARIKDNPKIGLPDDYKRFLLHGKKLLSHLNHYERRSPEELQPLRKQLEEKLPQIEAEAERLHKEIQAKIVGGGKSGGDTIHQTSIFDRANSLSESDSGTTSSQSHSQQMWTPTDEVGYPEYFVSPIATDSEHLYNAYGLPYPLDDDDDITPTPHDTPKPGFNQTSLPEDQGNWQTVPEYHRRQQKKSSTLLSNGKDDYKSPAEVGVSRYIAQAPQRGSHFSSRDSLAEIRKHSPTPPRGGGGIKGTRSPSSGNGTRPTGLLITGSNHYGGVASGLTPTDEPSHAEFSMAYATIPAPGTSMAAVTQRFNGTAAAAGRSGRKLSNESSGGKSTLAPTSTHTSPGIDQLATMPPFPVLTTRSAKSSPGQGISPFYPPDLPIERHSNSSLRRPANPPPSFHHWNTTSYHPGLGLPRVESSSLGEESMAMSFPLPDRTLRRQPGAVFSPSSSAAAAAVWPVADYAVSTTPMSRDSSHPSSNPSYNSRHRSTDSIRGVTNNNNNMNIVIPSSTDRDRGRRYSSPLSSPVSSVMPPNRLSATAAAGGGGGNNNNNNSRPTSIMTEPSPRITPRFDLIDPPYQSLLSNNNNNSSITIPMPTATARNNRPRAGSQSNNITGAVFPSSMGTNLSTALSPPPPPPQQQQQPTRRQSRYKRAWGKLRSNSRRGRSSSHSSSVSAGGRNSVHSSPGPGATPSFSSPPPSPPTFAMGVGGEPMGRSGSGGIIIGGGVGGGRRQIIEFGEVPIDIGVASHRLRERQQHQQHQQQQQQKENMAPPMSRSSSGGVGLGIMPEGEMR